MFSKSKLLSVVVVTFMMMVLLGGVSPTQAAPLTEHINDWEIDSINIPGSPRTECGGGIDNGGPFNMHVYSHANITWSEPPSEQDIWFNRTPLVKLYDAMGSELDSSYVGEITTQINNRTMEHNILAVISFAVTSSNVSMPRPWRFVMYNTNLVDEGGEFPWEDEATYEDVEIASLIFDPADYGACADLPYIGIQTGDPLIETAGMDTAIYNGLDDNGNPSLDVYGINDEGEGYYAFTITEANLAPFADNPPEENTEIMTVDNVALYALDTGEYQLNIGPDEEGKVRVVIFNGLPSTNVYSYDYNVYDILDE